MTTRIKKKTRKHAVPPADDSFSLISNKKLLALYAAMLQCRMLNEHVRALGKAAKLQSSRRLPPGREAVTTAVAIDLLPEDTVVSSAPDPLAWLIKGVPLENILRPLYKPLPGRSDAELYAARGIAASPSSGVACGSNTAGAVAAGAAFAHKLNGSGNVSVVFYSASEAQGPWREALDFAAAHRLPVIFVRIAGATASVAAAGPEKAGKQKGKTPAPNPPVIPVDRDDVVAVYRVAHEAIAHARNGSGPTLIDCVPLHLPGHHSPALDAIGNMEIYLQGKRLHPERKKEAVTTAFGRALKTAVVSARRRGKASGKAARSRKHR